MTTADAVKKLSSDLKRDKEFRATYHANIAMCFMDEFAKWERKHPKTAVPYKVIREVANNGATLFLEMFCGEIKYPEGR